MPWKPEDAKRHSKKADSPAQKRRWSEIANAVLEESGDEGKAIRIANARMRGERKKPHGKRGR